LNESDSQAAGRRRGRSVFSGHNVEEVMKRAAELFVIERQASHSPYVEETWWSRSEPEDSFISVAECHWQMCVTRQRGAAWLTVRGPHTKATITPIPEDAEFFGIQFSLGTFMPELQPGRLVDRAVTLPPAKSRSFWLDGSAWELPGPENADTFVDRLVRAGLVVHDPVASAALQGDAAGLSTRSVERRVVRATGLTRGAIRQIRRADRAVELLSAGVLARDAARRAGYADQPHLTRSLKRFVGQTPSQIESSANGE
jgi:Helix-turn-helix domain